jgi:hypothetical protein
LGAKERVSKCLKVELSGQPCYRAVGAFYSPLRKSSRWVSVTRTCPGRGLDMSGNHLWNLAKKPDKAGVTWDKADRLNMSGLWAEHVRAVG